MPHFYGGCDRHLGILVEMLAAPSIQFAERGGSHLAYQIAGAGPTEIVFVGGSQAISLAWEEPAYARGLRRMASFSKLVTYDQRGMGYSDHVDQSAIPTISDLVDDLAAVIQAANLSDPIVFGTHNGGAVAAAYAASHPVRGLILCNTWARLSAASDYPIGFPTEVLDALEESYRDEWGQGRITRLFGIPRIDVAPTRFELASTSRNQAVTLFRMNREYDIRELLPSLSTPTLVVHLEDNALIPATFGTYIAESVPGATLKLVPGTDQFFLRNYSDPVIDKVEEFVTGETTQFIDTVSMAMLFTDIVDSTPLAASLSGEAWSTLIEQHNNLIREQIAANLGDEAKCTGDGFLVTFDEPALAVRCALGAINAVAELGLKLRAGVHVGVVSRMGRSDIAGVEVHFAQRVSALAGADQVLISAAAKELLHDSDISVIPWGTTSLKGIPGEWEIFQASLNLG
jgi:class 3 adenylate cyclase